MRLATAHQMREVDRITIEEYGLSGVILMERAGVSVSDRICTIVERDKNIVVICGKGNNGGDALVVGREMTNRGYNTICYLFALPEELTKDSYFHYERAIKYGVDVRKGESFFDDIQDLKDVVLVDGIFGTGLGKPIDGIFKDLIDAINTMDAMVFSIDIPSGVCSDTGFSMKVAIDADYTVTFNTAKAGHFLNDGLLKKGKLFIEDIGLPRRVIDRVCSDTFLIDAEMVISRLPKRPVISSKHDYGHVLVIAGARGKSGASLMCSRSALRSGAGLVTLASSRSLIDSIQSAVLEEMTLPLPEDDNGILSKDGLSQVLQFVNQRANVIAIGPGLGQGDGLTSFIKDLISQTTKPLVMDADALNVISRGDVIDTLKKANAPIVITPHEGEMKRLTSEIHRDRIRWSRQFAQRSGAVVCLKGAPTIISTPDGRSYINSTGNPGMATAGSGDVLTGLIGGLIAQGLTVEDAAVAGVYVHGLAGDIARDRYGEHALIAGDIINCLPDAFKDLLN
ncbi:MAG: NAD(P)H-hydrate dehydratase [Thermodesulfovibrionales bacterium]